MSAPYFAYGAIGITDTNSSLDAIHAQSLRDNDLAIVVDDNKIYFYQMHAHSTKTNDPPYVVKPIDASEESNKKWHLISQEIYTTDIIQLVGNYIQTSKIKAISGNEIQLQASNGQMVRVNTDGSVTFPSFVIMDQDPTNDNHIVNKLYTDTEITTTHDTLETHIDTRVFNIESVLKDYTDTEFSDKQTELTNYLDTSISTLQTQLTNHISSEFDTKETNLTNHIDAEIGLIQGILEDYTDTEINNVVDNVYPILLFEVDTWIPMNDKYYTDINHNKNKVNVIVRCWNTNNIMIYPYRVEALDGQNVRIWMPTDNEELRVVIL